MVFGLQVEFPVYLALQHAQIRAILPVVGIACAGALLGTFAGRRLLERLPERLFRPAVSLLTLALGIYMLAKGIRAL